MAENTEQQRRKILCKMFQLLMLLLAAAFLVSATWQDIKHREISDFTNFSFFFLLFFSLLAFYTTRQQWSDAGMLVAVSVAFFLMGYTMYKARMFGGGDAKLMLALAPTTMLLKGKVVGFLVCFLFVSSFYGFLGTIFIAARNWKKVVVSLKKFYRTMLCLFLVPFVLLLLVFVMPFHYAAILFLVVQFLVFFYILALAVENACLIVAVPTEKLQPGEWLAKPLVVGKTTLDSGAELSATHVNLLKKYRKYVLVKQGIPFAPAFFLTFIVSSFVDVTQLLLRVAF